MYSYTFPLVASVRYPLPAKLPRGQLIYLCLLCELVCTARVVYETI